MAEGSHKDIDVSETCGSGQKHWPDCATSDNIHPDVSTATTENDQDIVQSTITCSPSTLYVGTIKGKSKFPDDITDADFEQHFIKFKAYILSTKIVRDPRGRPNGYGFVTFSSHEIAETARKAFSKKRIRGCVVCLRHCEGKNEGSHVSKRPVSSKNTDRRPSLSIAMSRVSKVECPATSKGATQRSHKLSKPCDSHSVCSSNHPSKVNSFSKSTEKSVKNLFQPAQDYEKASSALSLKETVPTDKDTLLIEGIHSQFPDSIGYNELMEHFVSFKNDIVFANMIQNPETQQTCGIIKFSSIQVAHRAQKKYNGTHLCRRFQIRVLSTSYSTVHPTASNHASVSESSSIDNGNANPVSIKRCSIKTPATVQPSTQKGHENSKHSTHFDPEPADVYDVNKSKKSGSSPGMYCSDDSVKSGNPSPSVIYSMRSVNEYNEPPKCLEYDPDNVDDKESDPKSRPDLCDKSVGASNSSAVIVIENLSPLINEKELKALIQKHNVTILSLNLQPDPTAVDETYRAHVSLADHSQAAAVINGFNGIELLRRKPRVYLMEYARGDCKTLPSVTEKRKISLRLFKFICYHCLTQVKQFERNGGDLTYCEDSAILNCQDRNIITQFLHDVFNRFIEKRVKFDNATWCQLSASRGDHSPSLLDEARSNFKIEMDSESDVYIVSQIEQHVVIFVGTKEGVKRAHDWMLNCLYGQLKVDSVKMEALVTIHPNMDSELSRRHEVKVLQYSKVFTEIIIKGDGTNVQTVHEKIKALLSKFDTLKIQFEHPIQLLNSARKIIKENELEVCIESEEATLVDRKTSSLYLTICSFNPQHLKTCVSLLKRKPTYKSLKIPSDVAIHSQKLIKLQRAVGGEYEVFIRCIYKENVFTSLLICGFVRNDVHAAHTELLENMSSFAVPRRRRVSSLAEEATSSVLVKNNPEPRLKPTVPHKVTHPIREVQMSTKASFESIDCAKEYPVVKQLQSKDNGDPPCLSEPGEMISSHSVDSSKHISYESPQWKSNLSRSTVCFEAHFIPLFFSHNIINVTSEVEKVHGVEVLPTCPSLMNSVVKQVIFRSSSNHLIAVQLCYSNLIYEKVDAIINSSCHVPDQMQAVGGTTLQKELDDYLTCHQAKPATEVCTVLESGNIPCKKIIHAFSCFTERETVEQKNFCAIHEALKCACKHDLQSISFSSACADTSSVETLMHDIRVFFTQNPNSSIQLLRIVCSSVKSINSHIGVQEFTCKNEIIDLRERASLIQKPPLNPYGSLHPVWYWQGDDDIYVAYPKNINDKLCIEHKISPKGTCYFQVSSNLYIANFAKMEQMNISTKFVRKMKVEYNSNEKHTVSPHDTARIINITVEWFYYSDKGHGTEREPYSTTDSTNIEKLYFSSPNSPSFVQGSRKFLLDFNAMKKYSQHVQPSKVLFLERKIIVHQSSCHSFSPKWYYMDDTNLFVSYSSQESITIEKMYQSHRPGTVRIQSREYTFNFFDMKQINKATKKERSIKRVLESSVSNCFEIVPQHLNCSGILVAIKGPSEHLTKAKNDLEDKLKSMLCTLELPLPLSVSSSNHSRTTITRIAEKHNVLSKFTWQTESSFKADSAPNVDSNVKLSGEENVVQSAIKAIMEEIASTKSTISIAEHEIPDEWQPQSQNTKLVELSKSSNEYVYVKLKFQSTMPSAVIVSIKRIQNNWLWERYVMTRKRLSKKNNGRVNEKQLFHGSRTSRAHMIYDSEEGFDMRYSSNGMWGQANYFAEKASYSNSYAYELGDGTNEILLAKVLTGDSYKSPSDQTLRMPPVKDNHTRFQQERYDTVEGETHGSRVFMTYSNDKAYPAYLIVYSPPSTTYNRRSSTIHATSTKTSVATPNWSYNLTPRPPPMQLNPVSSNTGASSGASPSGAHGGLYQPTKHQNNMQRSSACQPSPSNGNGTSSDQKSCVLQ